jgi:Xaa-Pro aminopeptidase
MVITIEPGWYDKSAGYGIRIEDTYVVTKDGFERLSAGAPREIDEIEALMRPREF